jgi:hypothetical protein
MLFFYMQLHIDVQFEVDTIFSLKLHIEYSCNFFTCNCIEMLNCTYLCNLNIFSHIYTTCICVLLVDV